MSVSRAGSPWLDTSRPIGQRVEMLMAEMTVAEKVGQTHMVANVEPVADEELLRTGAIGATLHASGATAGNERDAGVSANNRNAAQRCAVEASRLGIPLLFGRDVIHGHRTVFPVPLGMAAAFDDGLLEQAAEIAAAEASVDGIAWTFAPMLDICEDPRWGRVAESFGEAPALSGRLAAAAVRGLQGADPSAPEAGTTTPSRSARIRCATCICDPSAPLSTPAFVP